MSWQVGEQTLRNCVCDRSFGGCVNICLVCWNTWECPRWVGVTTWHVVVMSSYIKLDIEPLLHVCWLLQTLIRCSILVLQMLIRCSIVVLQTSIRCSILPSLLNCGTLNIDTLFNSGTSKIDTLFNCGTSKIDTKLNSLSSLLNCVLQTLIRCSILVLQMLIRCSILVLRKLIQSSTPSHNFAQFSWIWYTYIHIYTHT